MFSSSRARKVVAVSRDGLNEGLQLTVHDEIVTLVVYIVNNKVFDRLVQLRHVGLMKKAHVLSEPEFTDSVSSIFTARRDLMFGAKWAVAGSAFTVEEADLLISLYGASQLGWADLENDRDGYVGYKRLEQFLVHNPSLLSRRIIKLAKAKPALVEVADGDRTVGQHFNSKRVRITAEGMQRIAPVWQRFQAMSSALLQDTPVEMRQAHYQLNQRISERIRDRRAGLDNLFANGK